MKITLKLRGSVYGLMRQCGYHFERQDKKELVFSRILSASKSGYPRFHAYVKDDKASQETVLSLHLDQKKPIYKGTSAHAAEYEGKVIEKEAARIKKIAGL